MSFAYSLTDRIGWRATLGLIVLQSDETAEHDFRRLLPVDGVNLHISRVPSGLEVTGDTLAEMRAHLPAAAGLFPRPTEFDAVGYACTSGTSVIGAEVVAELVRQGCTAAQVTDPVTALIAACRALGVTRLALLSPYVAEVSATLRRVLADAGIETPVFGSFDEAEEARVARIAPQSIIDAATDLTAQGSAQDGPQALFLSCTNLRTLDVIVAIEQANGLPVLSSNQCLIWHLAQISGLPMAGPGRLFSVA